MRDGRDFRKKTATPSARSTLGSTIIDDADRKLIIHCSRPAGTNGMERVSEITEITISTVDRCSYAASRQFAPASRQKGESEGLGLRSSRCPRFRRHLEFNSEFRHAANLTRRAAGNPDSPDSAEMPLDLRGIVKTLYSTIDRFADSSFFQSRARRDRSLS